MATLGIETVFPTPTVSAVVLPFKYTLAPSANIASVTTTLVKTIVPVFTTLTV